MSHPDLFIRVMDDIGANTALLAHCTPATIFRVGRTCRIAHRAVKEYAKHAYNINKQLKRFFADPEEFRALQARTHFVISGSNALQFMDRTFYPESDLDIYVTYMHKYELGRYIMEKGGKGYVFRPSSLQPDDFEDAVRTAVDFTMGPEEDNDVDEFHWSNYRLNRINGVYTFESTDDERMVPLRVQIIVARKTPLDCILSFHSTVVMNAITYHAAYSLYPHGTFEENRTLVLCDPRETRNETALTKYEARGWTAEHDVNPFEEQDPRAPFQFGKRWVDDDMSWVLPLDRDASRAAQYTTSSTATFDPFSVQGWKLARHHDAEDGLPKMRYVILKPFIFEHMYTAHEEFYDRLRPWMAVQGRVQGFHGRLLHNGADEARFDATLPAWRETYMRNCSCYDCRRLRRRRRGDFQHWAA